VKNIIQSQLSEADRTKINGLITDIEAALTGKTGVLSADERRRYGSVNEQNKLVVNKAREFQQNKPAMSAPDVDWTEFENDYQARAFLENCIDRLNAVVQKLENTKIMHDYDNFQDALRDYGYSQYRFGSGDEDYGPKVSDYKLFFTKSKDTPPADEGGGDSGNGETPP
jgi:hypothetical protein